MSVCQSFNCSTLVMLSQVFDDETILQHLSRRYASPIPHSIDRKPVIHHCEKFICVKTGVFARN